MRDQIIAEWGEYFIRMSRFVALKSKDRSKCVGVIIATQDHSIVSTGYNGFPRGMDDDLEERHERPEKYDLVVHAETNAILNAARIGVSTKGCIAYMESSPCRACAHDLINAGVCEVVCCIPIDDQFAGDPTWDKSRAVAIDDMVEAGMTITRIPMPRKLIRL